MPRYVILINFTDQGMQTIHELPKRVQTARDAVERVGGKFLEWNLTLDQYDAVATIEVPDESLAAAILLHAEKVVNIRTTTLKAFTETEAAKLFKKLTK